MKNLIKTVTLGAALFMNSCSGASELERNLNKTKADNELSNEPSVELCVEHRHNYEDVFPGITAISNRAIEEVADYLTENGINTDIVEDSTVCEKVIFNDLVNFAKQSKKESYESNNTLNSSTRLHRDFLDTARNEESLLEVYDRISSESLSNNLDLLSGEGRNINPNEAKYLQFLALDDAIDASETEVEFGPAASYIADLEGSGGFQKHSYTDRMGESLINLKSLLYVSLASTETQYDNNINTILEQYISQVVAHEVLHSFQLPHTWDYADRFADQDPLRKGICDNKDTINILSYGLDPQLSLNDMHISGAQIEYVKESIDHKIKSINAQNEGKREPLRGASTARDDLMLDRISNEDYMCSENPYTN